MSTKRIPAHRATMIEALEEAIFCSRKEAKRLLAKSSKQVKQFYSNGAVVACLVLASLYTWALKVGAMYGLPAGTVMFTNDISLRNHEDNVHTGGHRHRCGSHHRH